MCYQCFIWDSGGTWLHISFEAPNHANRAPGYAIPVPPPPCTESRRINYIYAHIYLRYFICMNAQHQWVGLNAS